MENSSAENKQQQNNVGAKQKIKKKGKENVKTTHSVQKTSESSNRPTVDSDDSPSTSSSNQTRSEFEKASKGQQPWKPLSLPNHFKPTCSISSYYDKRNLSAEETTDEKLIRPNKNISGNPHHSSNSSVKVSAEQYLLTMCVDAIVQNACCTLIRQDKKMLSHFNTFSIVFSLDLMQRLKPFFVEYLNLLHDQLLNTSQHPKGTLLNELSLFQNDGLKKYLDQLQKNITKESSIVFKEVARVLQQENIYKYNVPTGSSDQSNKTTIKSKEIRATKDLTSSPFRKPIYTSVENVELSNSRSSSQNEKQLPKKTQLLNRETNGRNKFVKSSKQQHTFESLDGKKFNSLEELTGNFVLNELKKAEENKRNFETIQKSGQRLQKTCTEKTQDKVQCSKVLTKPNFETKSTAASNVTYFPESSVLSEATQSSSKSITKKPLNPEMKIQIRDRLADLQRVSDQSNNVKNSHQVHKQHTMEVHQFCEILASQQKVIMSLQKQHIDLLKSTTKTVFQTMMMEKLGKLVGQQVRLIKLIHLTPKGQDNKYSHFNISKKFKMQPPSSSRSPANDTGESSKNTFPTFQNQTPLNAEVQENEYQDKEYQPGTSNSSIKP